MTFVHTLVFSRATGLLVDEYSTVPPKIEDHVLMHTNDHEKEQDCFCFYFASGAKCWYANEDYRYEFKGGFIC